MTAPGDRVPIVAARSRAAIEGLAEDLLRRHAPPCLVGPRPTPVLRLFDRVLPGAFGFAVYVSELPPGIDGLTDPGGRTVTLAPAVYRGVESGDGRCRFSAAHEIAHVVLHGVELARAGPVTLAARGAMPAFHDPEWQANAFAAALLLPRAMVLRRLARPVRNGVSALVETFRVSRAAAGHRLAELDLSTRAARRSLPISGALPCP